jgi:hypothetical protein
MKEAKRKQSDESRLRETDEEISMASKRFESRGESENFSMAFVHENSFVRPQGERGGRWKTICDFPPTFYNEQKQQRITLKSEETFSEAE